MLLSLQQSQKTKTKNKASCCTLEQFTICLYFILRLFKVPFTEAFSLLCMLSGKEKAQATWMKITLDYSVKFTPQFLSLVYTGESTYSVTELQFQPREQILRIKYTHTSTFKFYFRQVEHTYFKQANRHSYLIKSRENMYPEFQISEYFYFLIYQSSIFSSLNKQNTHLLQVTRFMKYILLFFIVTRQHQHRTFKDQKQSLP